MEPIIRLCDIAQHTPTFQSCSGVAIISRRLDVDHMQLFLELMYLDKWDYASLQKKKKDMSIVSSPLEVRKSLHHWQYCTYLQLSCSLSSCTGITLYMCRCSCFNFSLCWLIWDAYLLWQFANGFFSGFASCNQKYPVLCPLFILVARQISVCQQMIQFP
jgi:hypothetical protein